MSTDLCEKARSLNEPLSQIKRLNLLCKTEETSAEMNYVKNVKNISQCVGNENGSNSLESYLYSSLNQISNGTSTKSVGLNDFDKNFMPNLAKFVFQVK